MIKLLVPRPTSQESDARMRGIVDRIGSAISGKIPPHIEYAEAHRPQWLLPTTAAARLELLTEIAEGGGLETVHATTAKMILRATASARAGNTDEFKTRLAELSRWFVKSGQLATLTADDVANFQARSLEAGVNLTDNDVRAAEQIERDRATWAAVGDALAGMETQGLADWSTNPEAAELAAFLGETGVIPTRMQNEQKMAIYFRVNDSVDAEELLKFLHRPLAEAFPEYGDLSVSDAQEQVRKLKARKVTGPELKEAKARLTQAQAASREVEALPEATAWLPKPDTDGIHTKGYRVMDVFGEIDPLWTVYSADQNDKMTYLTTALLGTGVHPDQQPEVAVEALSNDGMRAGSVFMELADTNDPNVRKVVMSRSHHKLLRGSANLHISGTLQVRSEGDTHTWGQGEGVTEADVGPYAIETALDQAPEGYELGKTTTKIDAGDRSLFGVRIYRLDNNGENPILHRPSTMVIYIPNPLRGIKSVKHERQLGDPAMEEPLPMDRPTVMFDEKDWERYFADRGITDTGRLTEVELDWKEGRITSARVFVNDVATAAYAKQLMVKTGVPEDVLEWKMIDVAMPTPGELTAVA
jgi:hypothetical protein